MCIQAYRSEYVLEEPRSFFETNSANQATEGVSRIEKEVQDWRRASALQNALALKSCLHSDVVSSGAVSDFQPSWGNDRGRLGGNKGIHHPVGSLLGASLHYRSSACSVAGGTQSLLQNAHTHSQLHVGIH